MRGDEFWYLFVQALIHAGFTVTVVHLYLFVRKEVLKK